jgi:hypothetical protein
MEHPFTSVIAILVIFREGTVVAKRVACTEAMITVGDASV